MTCEAIRAALSARLDGEDPPDRAPGPAVVDLHLAACPACQEWLRRAERITRAVRIQPVQVPDLIESIMARVAADGAAQATGDAPVPRGRLRARRAGALPA